MSKFEKIRGLSYVMFGETILKVRSHTDKNIFERIILLFVLEDV